MDCSGAFVYAYKLHEEDIYHGSNRIAREEVEELLPMSRCEPGFAVFKYREPGSKKYALPSAYRKGGSHYNGDLNDYYHIGLAGHDGKVMNAQSAKTGFVNGNESEWHCCGRLKKVDYAATQPPEEKTAKVVAKTGSTVNLRQSRSTKSALLVRIPLGSSVKLMGDAYGGWYQVKYKSYNGYVMAEFLEVV